MEKLTCSIVDYQPARDYLSEANYHYEVRDEANNDVFKGTASSQNWAKKDTQNTYASKIYDERFPEGWKIEYNF